MSAPKAVLLTGVYGSGKSSMCEEIAELLEEAGTAYGAIDLDWLGWFHVFGLADDEHDRVGLSNLSAVVGNYMSAGVDHFVLAGFVGSAADLGAFRTALPFPIRVVRLTLPYEEVEVRLSSAVTAGRAKDLQEARLQSERVDAEIGDLVVANDRPIRKVADEILDWLNWR